MDLPGPPPFGKARLSGHRHQPYRRHPQGEDLLLADDVSTGSGFGARLCPMSPIDSMEFCWTKCAAPSPTKFRRTPWANSGPHFGNAKNFPVPEKGFFIQNKHGIWPIWNSPGRSGGHATLRIVAAGSSRSASLARFLAAAFSGSGPVVSVGGSVQAAPCGTGRGRRISAGRRVCFAASRPARRSCC